MRTPIRIATRPSPLAIRQAESVAASLGTETRIVTVSTRGDESPDVPLREIGGAGVFAKEVQLAVLRGDADIAVHSAKDLPPVSTPGLTLVAVPAREDPRDVLIGRALSLLAEGATVATGSIRRRVQLARIRPDLRFVELRGNIATRLARVPDGGAVVMALAALRRLGKEDAASEILEPSIMLPQVGQGALAVECRTGDEEVHAAVAALDDAPTHRCVDAERSYLAALGGSCDLPVGAWAVPDGAELSLDALAATTDATHLVRHRMKGHDPVVLGVEMARRMLDDPELSLTAGRPA